MMITAKIYTTYMFLCQLLLV